MDEEKGLDSIKSDSMREFYEKMIYDFSFLNQFGFYYKTYFFHWITPGIMLENKKKNLEFGIYFSMDMGENRFYISLYYENTLNCLDGISYLFNGILKKFAYYNDSDFGYAIQYPIIKQKLIDYLYELRERGIV